MFYSSRKARSLYSTPKIPPTHPLLGGRRLDPQKLFSRREKGNGLIWMDLRSAIVGEMKAGFLAGYRRKSGIGIGG